MTPSSSKPGIARLIQPWPNYINKFGTIGRRHYGIDIMSGYYSNDCFLSVEPSKVLEVKEGSSRVSGRVKLEGVSGFIMVYKHCGQFKVEEGDTIECGVEIAKPNYTNTDSKHLHLEVWDGATNYDPLLFLSMIQTELKYEFTTSYPIEKYYIDNHPELYERIKGNIIPREEQVWR